MGAFLQPAEGIVNKHVELVAAAVAGYGDAGCLASLEAYFVNVRRVWVYAVTVPAA
jgi:hypothetical protein